MHSNFKNLAYLLEVKRSKKNLVLSVSTGFNFFLLFNKEDFYAFLRPLQINSSEWQKLKIYVTFKNCNFFELKRL